jgi:hypothetical protein
MRLQESFCLPLPLKKVPQNHEKYTEKWAESQEMHANLRVSRTRELKFDEVR